jgi:hypothetical protein
MVNESQKASEEVVYHGNVYIFAYISGWKFCGLVHGCVIVFAGIRHRACIKEIQMSWTLKSS